MRKPFSALTALVVSIAFLSADEEATQSALLETFSYRTPLTPSILTPEALARLPPDNVIHIWGLAGGEFQTVDDRTGSSPTAGLVFYNEGGFGVGDLAVRADVARRLWTDGESSVTARFATTLFKPLFEGPTWTVGSPRDDLLLFRVGAVFTGTYGVRLNDRVADVAKSRWAGETGIRMATGPLTYADMTIGRQEDVDGFRVAGVLHVPILRIHSKIRLFAYAEVGRGFGGQADRDDFSTGLELMMATLK